MEISNTTTDVLSAMTDLKNLEQSANVYKTETIPSGINMSLSGIGSERAIAFLFSPNIDKLIDNILDICINGKFDVLNDMINKLVGYCDTMGIGSGFFGGKIGSNVILTIKNSVNSIKFQKTASKIKKVLLVLKNLQKTAKTYKDPVERQKYEDAIYAIKSVVSIVATLYKNRAKINGRVIKGINNIIFEDTECETIEISKVTC